MEVLAIAGALATRRVVVEKVKMLRNAVFGLAIEENFSIMASRLSFSWGSVDP